MKNFLYIALIFLFSCSKVTEYNYTEPSDTKKLLIWSNFFGQTLSVVGNKTGKLYNQRRLNNNSSYFNNYFSFYSLSKKELYRLGFYSYNQEKGFYLYVDTKEDLLNENFDSWELINTREYLLDINTDDINFKTAFLNEQEEIILLYEDISYNNYSLNLCKISNDGQITQLLTIEDTEHSANIYYFDHQTNTLFGYYYHVDWNYNVEIHLTQIYNLNNNEYSDSYELIFEKGIIYGEFIKQEVPFESGVNSNIYVTVEGNISTYLYSLNMKEKISIKLMKYEGWDAVYMENSTNLLYTFEEHHTLKIYHIMSGDVWHIVLRNENQELEDVDARYIAPFDL